MHSFTSAPCVQQEFHRGGIALVGGFHEGRGFVAMSFFNGEDDFHKVGRFLQHGRQRSGALFLSREGPPQIEIVHSGSAEKLAIRIFLFTAHFLWAFGRLGLLGIRQILLDRRLSPFPFKPTGPRDDDAFAIDEQRSSVPRRVLSTLRS